MGVAQKRKRLRPDAARRARRLKAGSQPDSNLDPITDSSDYVAGIRRYGTAKPYSCAGLSLFRNPRRNSTIGTDPPH